MTDKSKLSQNPFLLATTIIAVCSLLVSLAGACTLKVLQGAWWIVAYQVILVLGHVVIFMRGVLSHYRLAMLTLLAISIPLLTIQIDYVLQYSKPAQLNRFAANAYAAGYIGLVIVQYIWVLVLGSEPTSYLGQLAQEARSIASSIVEPQFYSEKQPVNAVTSQHESHQPGDSIQDFSQVFVPHAVTTTTTNHPHLQSASIMNSNNNNSNTNTNNNSIGTYNASTHRQSLQPPASSASSAQRQSYLAGQSMPSADFKERVEAIHTYKANPQDPNELDFQKGEIVEIVDRKGNWWQARKADGRVGIIPSNYFRSIQG